MSYDYKKERDRIFTEEGQVMFLKIRDEAKRLIELAGAAKMSHITKKLTGDSWLMLACVDRLVELGELRAVTDQSVWGQHQVYIAPWA